MLAMPGSWRVLWPRASWCWPRRTTVNDPRPKLIFLPKVSLVSLCFALQGDARRVQVGDLYVKKTKKDPWRKVTCKRWCGSLKGTCTTVREKLGTVLLPYVSLEGHSACCTTPCAHWCLSIDHNCKGPDGLHVFNLSSVSVTTTNAQLCWEKRSVNNNSISSRHVRSSNWACITLSL
jgi:hypothetical protein